MSTTTGTTTAPPPLPTDLPAGAAIPYLAVRDARQAIDWYVDVFGARVVHEPIVMPDDRIGHVELEVGTGLLYMADEYPEIGHVAPVSGAAAVGLVLRVPDVDATIAAAVAAGAELTREIYEDHGHRGATIVDPFGHRWMVQTPVPDPAPPTVGAGSGGVPTRHGDIVYASLWVRDDERAATFFGSVLGWQTEAAAPGHARQVEGAVPHLGLMARPSRPNLMLCYAVDDLEAAVERVRSSGRPSRRSHRRAVRPRRRVRGPAGSRLRALPTPPGGDRPGRRCIHRRAAGQRPRPRRPLLRHHRDVRLRSRPGLLRQRARVAVHRRPRRRRLAGGRLGADGGDARRPRRGHRGARCTGSTTSNRPWPGCAPPAARRPIRRRSPTGSPPSASTTRARASTSVSSAERPQVARIRLLRALCSTSARPRCSMSGGTYMPNRPRSPFFKPYQPPLGFSR